MNKVVEKWDEILQIVKTEHDLSDVSFNTWLKPLTVYEVVDNVVTIIVPSEQVGLNYISKKYKLPLQVTISEVTGMENCDINFILPEDVPKKEEVSPKAQSQDARCEEAHLNPKYTFDTFVVGSNNKFAQAAALAVAESPGDTYNPLFIYGGAGLGKTHLMHSIAHFIIDHDENSKVLYVTSEEFTNELIETIRNGNNSAMTKFREKYRNIDVFLVDDIQFIAGKDSTEEEFFHTFNALVDNGKQVVLTADRPPKEIKSLTDRLASRFVSGLLADIQTPEYDTRCAIIKRKAELLNFEIDDNVIQYIAGQIKSNIRQLEGITKKLHAMCVFGEQKPTIALAQTAIKDILTDVQPLHVTVDRIVDEVSRTTGVSVDDIMSKKHTANVSDARKMCFYIIREVTDMSYKNIGSKFNRDHSTVMYNIEKMEERIKTDSTLNSQVSDIISNIKDYR